MRFFFSCYIQTLEFVKACGRHVVVEITFPQGGDACLVCRRRVHPENCLCVVATSKAGIISFFFFFFFLAEKLALYAYPLP